MNSIVLKSEESEFYDDLPAGTTASIIETPPGMWVPTYLVSNDPSNDNENVVVGPGEDVTVLIVNQLQGAGTGIFEVPTSVPPTLPVKRNDDSIDAEGVLTTVAIPTPRFITGFWGDK